MRRWVEGRRLGGWNGGGVEEEGRFAAHRGGCGESPDLRGEVFHDRKHAQRRLQQSSMGQHSKFKLDRPLDGCACWCAARHTPDLHTAPRPQRHTPHGIQYYQGYDDHPCGLRAPRGRTESWTGASQLPAWAVAARARSAAAVATHFIATCGVRH